MESLIDATVSKENQRSSNSLAPASIGTNDANNEQGPKVLLARFTHGNIQLFPAYIRQEPYIAISHVWGDKDWRFLPSIGREILVSEQKLGFIQHELPDLVGNVPFWMDTLTVDQRNEAEVIATVQSIPAIFRHATKTIAVRESDGLYSCCSAAVVKELNKDSYFQCLVDHIVECHDGDINDESYLRRLWTLQECLLSHTIQFVNISKGTSIKAHSKFLDDVFRSCTDVQRTIDSIRSLGQSFTGSTDSFAFEKAYIQNGTVTRPLPPLRNWDEDVYSGSFKDIYWASERSASLPRDYIFATMPQFPWYQYPKEAEKMTFNEIFADFCMQAKMSGHGFICRITKSMTEVEYRADFASAWEPSNVLWEPTSLGDFLKLLGGKLYAGSDITANFPTTRNIFVKLIGDDEVLNESETFEILSSTMSADRVTWSLAQRCGELNKYGSWPEEDTKTDLRDTIQNYEEAARKKAFSDTKRAYLESIAAHHKELLAQRLLEEASNKWIFIQARKVLANMWGSIDPYMQNKNMAREFEVFLEDMNGKWSREVLKALVLLAAMLSCQLPLSATDWATQMFVPIQVYTSPSGSHGNEHPYCVLGLLSKQWVPKTSESVLKHLLACCQHNDKGSPTNVVIVEPNSFIPVGLLPCI